MVTTMTDETALLMSWAPALREHVERVRAEGFAAGRAERADEIEGLKRHANTLIAAQNVADEMIERRTKERDALRRKLASICATVSGEATA